MLIDNKTVEKILSGEITSTEQLNEKITSEDIINLIKNIIKDYKD